MEERQLAPLINAAVLAGEAHQMLTQQQQPLFQNNYENGNNSVLQGAPPLQLQDVVQAMNPSALNNHIEPLDHPTLPQMSVQPAAAATGTEEQNTNSNHNHNSDNNFNLNHPQNEAYKLRTNQHLLESSSRLDDAASELSQYAALLPSLYKDTTSLSNQTGAQECLTNITQSIIPLLKVCSNAMKDAGKYFAPFSGTVNIHNRNDAELKRRLVRQQDLRLQQQQQQQENGGRRKKRPALLMIDEFVERSNVIVSTEVHCSDDNGGGETALAGAAAATANTTHNEGQLLPSQPTPTTITKRKSTTKTSKTKTTVESVLILHPRNGTVYTKSEALAIAKRYRKGSRERGLAIRAMIHKKFVLSSRKTLYRLLQMDEEGREVLENGWLGCGRPVKDAAGGGGVGVRRDRVVDSTLRFEDLDVGSNRILVELGSTKTKNDDVVVVGPDDGDNVEEGDTNNNKEQSQSNKRQQQQQSKTKKGKRSSSTIPPSQKGQCSAPGCTNQIARRGLCVRHGLQDVDPKIIDFPLPLPQDGSSMVYKKSECVAIAKQYKKGSSQRRLALEAMIYRGYVKNSLKSLYRLLLNDEKGIPITDEYWRGMGCPSVLSATEIDEVIDRIKREDIRLGSDDDVRGLVVDALMSRGVTDESKLKFSATTVKNYAAIFKSRLSVGYWKNDVESDGPAFI